MRGHETIVVVALAAACAGGHASAPPDGGGDPGIDAAPDDVPAGGHDGFPEGAIAPFLSTACPGGWSRYDEATGRTIVPVAGEAAGAAVGDPLGRSEQRAHHHDLPVTVDLGSVSFAGIAGEANHGVARGGQVEVGAVTDDGVAGLPYAQLLFCRKAEPAGAIAPPRGVIAFFADASCPTGWTDATALHGRVLVSLPAGGTPGAVFGGAPLAPGEIRTHVHEVSATVGAGSHGIALAGGCCAGGYGAAGDHAATASAAPAAVGLPYLQLLACVAP